MENAIQVGDILTLPFWADGDSDFGDYEVEKIGTSPVDGSPYAHLIRLYDGKREKTRQGHYVRSGRNIEDIIPWLAP